MSSNFEYKVVPWLRQFAISDRDLNRHGKDGWELVSTMPESEESVLLIFKRCKPVGGDEVRSDVETECGEDSDSELVNH